MPDIKQRISLDGADDVVGKLKKIGDTGSDAFKKLKEFSDKGGEGVAKLGKGAEDIGSSVNGAQKLREVLHTLRPVLDEAGLGMGNLGAFARAANVGIAGFGLAVVGSALIGLGRLADGVDDTKKKLADLRASPDAFKNLEENAKKAHTSVDKLAPIFEQIIGHRNDLNSGGSVVRPTLFERPDGTLSSTPPNLPPKAAGSDGDGSNVNIINGAGRSVNEATAQTASKSLFELTTAGKADDPQAAAVAFATAVREAKGLTVDIVEAFRKQSPGAADNIAKSLGVGTTYQDLEKNIQRRPDQKIDAGQVFSSLAEFEPQAAKLEQEARGITEAFSGLGAAAKRLTESLVPEHFGKDVGHTVDKATGVLDTLADANKKTPQGHVPLTNIGAPALSSLLYSGLAAEGAKGDQSMQGNGVFNVMEFLKNAFTNPGAIQEQQRPESGPSSLQPAPETKADTGNLGEDVRNSGDKTVGTLNDQKGILERIVDAIAAAVSKPAEVLQNGPAAALGVRGYTGGFFQMLADGGLNGRIRGPGGPKEDKVPAMLSDGEFVVNAEQTSKHLGLLHAINAGHYADGGYIQGDADWSPDTRWSKTTSKNGKVVSSEKGGDAGGIGAWINRGSLTQHLVGGDFQKWLADQARGQASADTWDKFERARDKFLKPREFVAGPGPHGEWPGAPQEPQGFAEGGLIGNLMPPPSISSSRFDPSSMLLESSSGGTGGLHPFTLDFSGIGRKIEGLFAHPSALEQLQQESILAQAIRTGIAPSSAR
jgi:hypothetical protein